MRVLGPVEVELDGQVVAVGGPKARTVLGRLLLDHGRVVGVDRLVEAVWGHGAGLKATETLQVYVSGLRRALEPVRSVLGADIIVTRPPGYLAQTHDGIDIVRFEDAMAQARVALSPRQQVLSYRSALREWRGHALDGIGDEGDFPAIRASLEAARTRALRGMLDAELALGNHDEVLDEAVDAAGRYPLDEGLQGLLMLALYRCGRQADALAVFRVTRERLLDELGVDPSPDLRAMETLVLRQDHSLARPDPHGGVQQIDDPTIVRTERRRSAATLSLDGLLVVLERSVTTVGRASDRHLVLIDGAASRCHAEFRRTDDGYRLVDVGSANGTRLNGRLIHDEPLTDGDLIEIGESALTFHNP